MKIRRGGGTSSDIEDRRGRSGAGLPLGRGAAAGGGGLVLIIALIASVCAASQGGGGSGFDLGSVLQEQVPGAQFDTASSNEIPPSSPEETELVEFVSFVLDDLQATWDKQFTAAGMEYRDATLVLVRGSTPTACGTGSSQMGPFYCPADESVYLDLNFFEQLARQFGAPGDFAAAYVIAHEIGHHVQKLTGISEEVRRLQQQNPEDANQLSVRQELQADCFAGVWGTSVYERGLLEPGDIEEGLQAATAVGDDYIQANLNGGRVNPENWTHGSSEQRVDWFQTGFDSGEPQSCDTFSVDEP